MAYSSPQELREDLAKLCPAFASDEDAMEATSFHQLVMAFTPYLKDVLKAESPRKSRAFGALVNRMVDGGGSQQNAIETCLLEHASQIGCAKLLKPHLSAAAKKELR
jgi:hypothetical protein